MLVFECNIVTEMNKSDQTNDTSATEGPRGILNVTSYSLNDRSRASDRDGFDESEIYDDAVLQLLDKPFSQLVDGMQLRKNDRYAGFDNNAGDSWIYPTNYPVRKYQFSITSAALFKNTLVVLPTGLGKTFIAAVVMYNIYRWYPTGKVIFMAPTRPLVNQQIEACYKIMGIPKEDTAEMTGKQQRKNRCAIWQSKRVFYVTPQVVQADLNSPEQNFPTNSIKLIVIDEAHKAKGRYAYAEVIKAISATNKNFRVLALSATPGRTLEDVAEVIQNLLISHIEVRWENSIDVSPYTFKKNIRTIVIPLGPTVTKIKDNYIDIIDPYVRRLLDANVVSGHTGSLNRGWLIMEQKKFREACLIQRHPNFTSINSDFSACVSLYHALELLVRHGVRSFINFFEDEKNSTEEKYFVAKDPRLKAFLDDLREQYGKNPLAIFNNISVMPNGAVPKIAPDEKVDFGHPKFAILERNLREHFQNNPDSKVIIFCEFRDSVAMIHRLLLQNRPVIKPKCIVGQGGTGGGLRAVTQKEQIAAMRDFRSGVCNTLIATCVAEEGIDVGEVDLIVCFDITKNPTRFVQRIGRTGRQRVGRVLMLVTEGKEHETLKEVLASKDKTNQKLSRSREILSVLYRQSPRLVPTEFDPKCVETFIKIPEESTVGVDGEGAAAKRGRKRKNAKEQDEEREVEEVDTRETRKRRKKKDAAPSGTQDVRNFFRKVDTDLDASERDVFSSAPSKDTSVDSPNTSRERFKAPPDASIRLGKTEQEQELEKLTKPLLRHRARLEREKYLNDRKLIVLREEKISKLINCPNRLKKLFLESNVEHLKDMVEKSDILQAAVGEDDDDDLILLDDRGDCLKSEMRIIEGLFGGRSTLKERISDIEEYRKLTNRLLPRMESNKEVQKDIDDDQVSNYNDIFARFSTHSLGRHYVKEQPKHEQPVNSATQYDANDPSTSNLFDSQCFLPAMLEQEESRYQMQIPPEPSREETPVNPNKSKSRISILAKSEKRTPPNYANSPLLRAFNRSIQKAKNSDYASPVTSRSNGLNFRMVLEYFGLNNLDQMFEEEEVGNRFLNRLHAVNEDDELAVVERTVTEHISELSRSLFDIKELNIEAQEAAFLAGDFSRKNLPEEKALCETMVSPKEVEVPKNGQEKDLHSQDLLVLKEVELLEADLMDGDFSAIEVSPPRTKASLVTQREIPIDEFLEENFSNDESPVNPTLCAINNSGGLTPLSASGRRKRELDLGIDGCLLDLVEEEPEEPLIPAIDNDEVIPNSQEEVTVRKNLPKESQKNLNIGNLQDLFADSDDDLFGNSEGSKKTVQGEEGSDSDKTIDYELDPYRISQKENILSDSNRCIPVVLPTTPVSIKKSNPDTLNSPQCQDKSPSLLRKKLNLSRLRLNKGDGSTSNLEVNSAPVGRMSSGGMIKGSPYFASCRPDGQDQRGPVASGFRQELERRFSFQRKNTSPEANLWDDTAVIAPRAKRKAIISSESEEDTFEEPGQESEEEDVFQTARSNIKTYSGMKPPMRPPPSSRPLVGKLSRLIPAEPTHRKKRRKRNEHCNFFLSQAEVSGDEGHEDDEEDEHEEMSQFVDDSIVDHGPVEEDAVDMRAIYVQSVRSPIRPGGFKIPAAPTRFMNTLDIYSQPPSQHDQQSMYEECSFIVHENEDAEEGEEEEEDEIDSEMDELERAEAILRQRRRAKKLGIKDMPTVKRRRKILSLGSDSEQSSDEGEELKAFRKQMRSMSEGAS